MAKKKPAISGRLFLLRYREATFNLGNVLLSHTVTHAVPSALKGLTSVFGMGTGVTPSPWSPRNLKTGVMKEWNDGVMVNPKKYFSFPNIPILHHSTTLLKK